MAACGGRHNGGAANCWIQAPVPIPVVPEGVVGDGGPDEKRAAEQAFAPAGGDFLNQRVEAVVEADGVHDAGRAGGSLKLRRLGNGDSQGLFADDVDLVFQGFEH